MMYTAYAISGWWALFVFLVLVLFALLDDLLQAIYSSRAPTHMRL